MGISETLEKLRKPGSVVGNHFSRTIVANRLQQPTRTVWPDRRDLDQREAEFRPAWSCSRRGLPCQSGHPDCGALLPHHFTLTTSELVAVSFLWHFPDPHGWWTLSTAASCGARTFLSITNKTQNCVLPHAAIACLFSRAVPIVA